MTGGARAGLRALLIASLLVPLAPLNAAAADVVRTGITVRVYQTAGLPPAIERHALAEARDILHAALVDVRWRPCTGTNAPTCGGTIGADEYVLRLIVRTGPVRDRAVAALGDALIDRRDGGVLATVYVDRVALLAGAAHSNVAVLLGRAVAHELGHLLMQTAAHARRGLMRQHWTREEIHDDHASDWRFTTADVAAMTSPEPGHAASSEMLR